MPGVSSATDGGFQNYQQLIADYEKDQAEARTREKARTEKYENDLEAEYTERARENQDKYEKAAQTIREESLKTHQDYLEKSGAEQERFRKQTYDNFGRMSDDRQTVVRQLDEQSRAMDAEREKQRQIASKMEENYARKEEEREKAFAEKLEKAVQSTRDSISIANDRNLEKSDYDYYKNELEKKYTELDRQRNKELNQERQQLQKAILDSERDYDHRTAGVIDSAERRMREQHQRDASELDRSSDRLRESHRAESEDLRGQIKNLVDAESNYMRERGQGRQDAVREYENEWRDRQRITEQKFKDELEDVKLQSQQMARHYHQINTDNQTEKDNYFAKVLKEQNQEYQNQRKSLENDFNRSLSQIQDAAAEDKQKSNELLRNERSQAASREEQALQQQARTFQDTLSRVRSSDQDEIRLLENELQHKKTSQDPTDVPPAAETAMRRAMVQEYQKNLQAEQERNARTIESMKSEYSDRIHETVLSKQDELTIRGRQHAMERNYDRQQFVSHIKDLEQTNEATKNIQEEQFRREIENLTKHYSKMMERQRREYEDILNAQKDDASARMLNLRQEHEFNSKIAQREASVRHNEQVREYDKKLAEQKQDYEARMEEVKISTQQELREGERKNRQALEEMKRAYEQRIAVLESQQKERERYLASNYQDEIEKVKRSNALLIQKKS